MRNPFLFFRDLAKQPLWVSVWVAILAFANLASIFFWPETLARVIFGTFIISAVLMMALYSYFGFEKILGLGHVFWILLLPYVVIHLGQVDRGFSLYLVVLSILITVALVFDVLDVWRYFREKRA
jgi:hypothetical protein